MKIFTKTLLFLFLLTTSLTAQINEYGLFVVSNIGDYNKEIKEYPSHKLIDLEVLIENIELDIVYATKENFTKEIIYKSAKAFLREEAANALQEIQKELNKQGLGLKIFDAYRPYSATVKFYEIYQDKNFVASPKTGSIHNRGCAVDLTIINLSTKKELEMPTGFDSFSEKASHNYLNLPKKVLKNRSLLKSIMEKYGFKSYSAEWWHYSYYKWEDYNLMDISFNNLASH